MDEKLLTDYYSHRGLSDEAGKEAVRAVLSYEEWLVNRSRAFETAGTTDIREKVFSDLSAPPAGSPPEAIPPVTVEIVDRLGKVLSEEDCYRALAAKAHGIPV